MTEEEAEVETITGCAEPSVVSVEIGGDAIKISTGLFATLDDLEACAVRLYDRLRASQNRYSIGGTGFQGESTRAGMSDNPSRTLGDTTL